VSDPGYFGAPVPVSPAPAPLPPPRRQRVGPVLALSGLLALVVAAGVVATTRVQAEAVGAVHALEAPAPAEDGWGPTYVDEHGRPARWDPCRPIRFVVNPGWIPDAGRRDLAEALRRITVASGLQFADLGDTDEMPSQDRPAYQPERYGEQWAPVLIAWVPAAATDLGLGGGVQGVSFTVAVPGKQAPSLVSGQVVLDASHRLASGFGPGTTDGEVLLHELAHAIGLGHVLDPTQVMYPQATNSESEFGAGDRAGLAALGASAGCHPAPAPRPLRMEH
jgi:hypothetical protein